MAEMRNLVRVLLGLLLLASDWKLAAQQTAPKRHDNRDACPDTRGWTGRYNNYSYHFSITIPKRLQGFWNSARCTDGPDGCICMSDHGRIIPLTKEPYEPERYIEVYAGYAVDLDKPTLAKEVDTHLDDIRRRSSGGNAALRRRFRTRLGGIDAERVVVWYYDSESHTWRIEDFLEALRDDVEYSLYLRTSEKSYTEDHPIFDSVIKSFTLRR